MALCLSDVPLEARLLDLTLFEQHGHALGCWHTLTLGRQHKMALGDGGQ